MSDLAASGSAILFIDSLDFYGKEERLTVIDLVREAAKVPGVSVIATARRDFGVVEDSWLPAAVLDQLGRAEPVFIDELSDVETEELRSGAPTLARLAGRSTSRATGHTEPVPSLTAGKPPVGCADAAHRGGNG